jgi:DNA-3-methyladenine glycosylase
MWGAPGYAYVYFIYGNHCCVNTVCRPEGIAEAVLIRAIEPSFGIDIMQSKRKVKRLIDLTNGPGKLCAAMAIDRSLNGVDLCDAHSPLFVGQNPDVGSYLKAAGPVVVSRRIGITKAADLPLRFSLAANPFVSRKPLALTFLP